MIAALITVIGVIATASFCYVVAECIDYGRFTPTAMVYLVCGLVSSATVTGLIIYG